MLNTVIDIISEFTEVKKAEIKEDSKLVNDLALNSFDVVNIVVRFEDEFDIEIPDEEIRNFRTISDIVSFIEENS